MDDAKLRFALTELYRKVAKEYLTQAAATSGDPQTARVYQSAFWLADHLADVPVFVIPCLEGRPAAAAPVAMLSAIYGSIFPAMWSFQLALRARGFGSTLTTLHLFHEQEAASLLGLPDDILQVALLPVAYTKGTEFKRAARPSVNSITHWNAW